MSDQLVPLNVVPENAGAYLPSSALLELLALVMGEELASKRPSPSAATNAIDENNRNGALHEFTSLR